MSCKHMMFVAIAASVLLCRPATGLATSELGTAQSFAVLGHETVTNGHSAPNPTTQVFGDLGVTPGTSVTGFFPDGTVSGGTIHINDAVAQLALADATTAKTNLGLMGPGTLLPADLVGLIIAPGVYTVPAGVTNLSGTVTLDGFGDADALWVFQTNSTLITSPSAVVNVINTGSGAGVYWNVATSATLDVDTVFAGNIIALDSVTLDPRAEILCGRAFALTGAVSLVDNLVSNNNSAETFGVNGRPDFGSFGFSGGGFSGGGEPPSTVPEPITLGGLLLGAGALRGYVRRRAHR